MTFAILGSGTVAPENRASQNEILDVSRTLVCENSRQERLMTILFQKSGIDSRQTVLNTDYLTRWKAESTPAAPGLGPGTGERMKLYAQHAGPLGCKAATLALKDSFTDAKEITHLVTVSCTGFVAPGIDAELINLLGLRPTVERVHVGYMGCHGAINGLRVARGLAATSPEARILLCAVEICTLHYRLIWDDEGVKGNALFSDGAGALVCGQPSENDSPVWTVHDTGSCMIPNSTQEMSWIIGDHGFEMSLSRQVPQLIEEHLSPWMSSWLDHQGQTVPGIGNWAVHPGGPRILDAVETSLGLPPGACTESRTVLRERGNMSSPTVLFVLDRLRSQPAASPTVMLGFGPGLTAEVALLSGPHRTNEGEKTIGENTDS